ncbi:MAG TPA: cytochrome c [Terriglobales bacterium]|nr:cytochrome c [Terriglobales bacterium]
MLLLALLALGCEREQRRFQEGPLPNLAGAPLENPYEHNAWALSEGQRLFRWYNCSGCHANGGGGMGPALTDDKWVYGSEPAQIFATIIEGRPNGMPSFRDKITDQEVWQLVTFVRSLSGMVRQDVASSRQDHMQVKPSALSLDQPQPKAVPPPLP